MEYNEGTARPAKKLYGYQRLHPRETQVLTLTAHGLSLKQIAARLNVTYKTADHYRQTIYAKWDVHTPIEMIRKAVATGYLPPDILTQKLPELRGEKKRQSQLDRRQKQTNQKSRTRIVESESSWSR